MMKRYKVGSLIWFEEDKLPYEIQALNQRYLICTRKLNKRNDADLLHREVEMSAYSSFTEAYKANKDEMIYTIVDLKNKIRGTENLIFCMGYKTKEQCQEALIRLTDGESEISHRNNIPLSIVKIIPDLIKDNGDDPRDNPLTDDEDWIHDVDMGAR